MKERQQSDCGVVRRAGIAEERRSTNSRISVGSVIEERGGADGRV